MNFVERFGRNLAMHRERAGISQEELGMRAGLHRTAVGQLERAQRMPRADTLVRLAGSLGVRPETLLEGLEWEPSVRSAGALIVAEDNPRSVSEEPYRELAASPTPAFVAVVVDQAMGERVSPLLRCGANPAEIGGHRSNR